MPLFAVRTRRVNYVGSNFVANFLVSPLSCSSLKLLPPRRPATSVTMYDVIAHPDSPVDSSMFPAVYDHTAVVKESELDQVLSVSVDSKVGHAKTLPSLIQVCGPSEDLKEGCIVYDCELEPFEYRPGQLVNTEDLLQKDTSLCSVFGDQDLVDAIFSSLDAEQAAAQQQQQQHLLALACRLPFQHNQP
ncbi:TPA: hypothetical protein N0F65_008419 [Lagenidium giganteum]|uniref:Uncharacterized protein n=1 Tax=Lagenidium giganteum TaxID=4803 RepID=A0AAV2Z074_9STRA|nr:TPA: hypothetical protein N0F65_008419 [Lagenidium giganteum]